VYPDYFVKRRALSPLGAALTTAITLGCGGDPASPERLPPQQEISDIGGASVLDGWATAVNSAGHVVGRMLVAPGGGYFHAFLWTRSGGMRDLGAIAGTLGHTTAEAINDRGQIVGVSGGCTSRSGSFRRTPPSGGRAARCLFHTCPPVKGSVLKRSATGSVPCSSDPFTSAGSTRVTTESWTSRVASAGADDHSSFAGAARLWCFGSPLDGHYHRDLVRYDKW
jgi:probable HAF family extracellular repeat protein